MGAVASSRKLVYGLRGRGWPVDLDRDWLESVEFDGRVCRRCTALAKDAPTVDIVIDPPPPKAAMSMVHIAELEVVERRLLDAIGWDVVEKTVDVGRVLDSSGKEYSDYCVVHPRHWVPTRETQPYVRRTLHCPKCGQCLGTLKDLKSIYVVRSSLGEGPLWTSHLYRLLVDEEIHARLAGQKWRLLSMDKIPIVDTPQDRLPEHIDHYVAPSPDYVESFVDM